jgi:hypothetical protein
MPWCVVMHPVLGQDGAQVRLTENQHAVKELSAQGAESRSQIALVTIVNYTRSG